MTAALDRILSTPLIAYVARGGRDGVTVRVARDKYHVATISSGMNDKAEYAQMFAAAPEMLRVLMLCMDRDDLMEDGDELGAAIRAAVKQARGDA